MGDIERESARAASRPSSRNKPAEELVEEAIITLTEEDVSIPLSISP